MAIVTLTTAPGGTGKTWRRCPHFIFEEWLPDKSAGVHWSNFPVHFEDHDDGYGLVTLAGEKLNMDAVTVKRRVQVIPKDELIRWKKGLGGPWDYFDRLYREWQVEWSIKPWSDAMECPHPLDAAHLAIDECHNYWPVKPRGEVREACKKFADWLAEARKQGCTVEFITQAATRFNPELKSLAGRHLILTNRKEHYNYILGCINDDIGQFWAKLWGHYDTVVIEKEKVQDGEGLSHNVTQQFYMDPWYFQLYDTTALEGRSGRMKTPPWQQYTWWGLIKYFWRRNWPASVFRVFAVLALFFLITGGLGHVFKWAMDGVVMSADANVSAATSGGKPTRTPGFAIAESFGGGKPGMLEPAKADLVGQNSQLIQDLQKAKAELHESQKERDELRAKLGDANALVLVDFNGVAMKNGDYYYVGQTIQFGDYRGRRIVSIRKDHGTCVLDDGRVLRLGRMPDGSLATETGPGPAPAVKGNRQGVSGTLRSARWR